MSLLELHFGKMVLLWVTPRSNTIFPVMFNEGTIGAMDLRVVFMGSPSFALPSLQTLVERFNVVGVVTQPDRLAGRGRELKPPAVKTLAVSLGLPVIQPPRLRDPEPVAQLRAWKPDLVIVAAFGQILRADVLDLPPHGCINVHASLLPRWRGASPVQHAILAGDLRTGVSIMKMDPGLDTGPVLAQASIPVHDQDTSASLGERLAQLGAALLVETLPGYLEGRIDPAPQGEAGVSYAPLLKKDDARLDFTKPAEFLARQVRAFSPWPGTFFDTPRGPLKVHAARVLPEAVEPGRRLTINGFPAVSAAEGVLLLEVVQPVGKKPMSGEAYLSGARDWSDPA